MRRNWTERVIGFVVVLFLAVMGYQIHRFFYQPVATDTLREYTVYKSLQTQGIAVREESVLDTRATGAEYYPVADAGRVALGETVAEISRSGQAANADLKRVRALTEEIQLLSDAQATRVDYSITENLNKDIKLQLGELSAMSTDGFYADLEAAREGLVLNINRKQVSNGKVTDYAARIQQLEEELAGLRQSAGSGGSAVVEAPFPGYFAKSCDGYEARLSPEGLQEMTVEEIQALIQSPPPGMETPPVGRMVHSEKWVFAVTVPAEYLEWIRPGQKMELQFEQVSHPVTATVRDIVDEKGKEEAVLLLACNQMNEELINLRVSGVLINFQQFTGIRINTKYLRFQANDEGGMDRGVYVLEDHVVKFRKLELLYEEEGFVLSKTYYVGDGNKEHVKLFDQVITKGTDLYDGKPIQDY